MTENLRVLAGSFLLAFIVSGIVLICVGVNPDPLRLAFTIGLLTSFFTAFTLLEDEDAGPEV